MCNTHDFHEVYNFTEVHAGLPHLYSLSATLTGRYLVGSLLAPGIDLAFGGGDVCAGAGGMTVDSDEE